MICVSPSRSNSKRRRGPDLAGDALIGALSGLGLTDQARRLLILSVWAKAVGPDIAARTDPESFSRGVLVVRAQSAAWQNELTFLKAEITAKLNQVLGASLIKDIKIIAGAGRSRWRSGRPAWLTASPTSDDLAQAEQASAPIADPELRGEFERLMCLHLRATRARHR